jgi:hypothetical protein
MPGTYLFYTVLMCGMILISLPSAQASSLGNTVHTSRYWGLNLILLLIFYSLVIGLRYYVGIDYEAYKEWYDELRITGVYPRKIEFGYEYLNQILYKLNAHYSFLFIFLAFFQIYFLYKALRKFPFLIPWYIFFFFTYLLMFNSINIMRQTLAYFAFFYAMNLALDRRYIKAILVCIFGFSFHTTIIIPIILFPFLWKDWFKNRYVQLGLIFFVSIFADRVLTLGLQIIAPVVSLMGYGYYVENLDLMYEISKAGETGAGTARILFLLLDIAIIWYSPNLKEVFKSYNFHRYYNLYFIGALLERMVYNNFILARTNDYLLNFRVLILAFLCYYLFQSQLDRRVKQIIGSTIALMMLAFFYRAIYNKAAEAAPFNFLFLE